MSRYTRPIPLPETPKSGEQRLEDAENEGFFSDIWNSIGEASDKLFAGVWLNDESPALTPGENARLVGLDAQYDSDSDDTYCNAKESASESEWDLEEAALPRAPSRLKTLRRVIPDKSENTAGILAKNKEALRERGQKLDGLDDTLESAASRARETRQNATAIRREAERRAEAGHAICFCL